MQLKYPVMVIDAAVQWQCSFKIAQNRLWNAEDQQLLISVKMGNRKLYSPSLTMLKKILEK